MPVADCTTKDPCDPCSQGCGPFAGGYPDGWGTGAAQGSPCSPGPANTPVTDAQYRCSLGVSLQGTVDGARRVVHALGLRPYRVALVWAERGARERYRAIRELELTPVQVTPVEDLEYGLTQAGRQVDGTLVVSQISPAQVQEWELRGKVNGGEDPPDDVEFFWEITRHPRCPDDRVRPGRYTPVGLPGYDGPGFQWVVTLAAQQNPRAPDGTPDRDQAFRPGVAQVPVVVPRVRR